MLEKVDSFGVPWTVLRVLRKQVTHELATSSVFQNWMPYLTMLFLPSRL